MNRILQAILLLGAYYISGKFGLSMAFMHSSATAVWPPSAIALAFFLLFGSWMWPGVYIGAFLVNLTTAGNVGTSLIIALGNTLEPLAACYFVNALAGGRSVFMHTGGVIRFAFFAGIVSTAISATLGVTALSIGGFAIWQDYWRIWFTWWLGDAASILILTPLVVLWVSHPRVEWKWYQVLELVILFSALWISGGIVFGDLFQAEVGDYPLSYFCVFIIIIISYRFDLREAATATALLSGISLWGTLHGFGPFHARTKNESLLLLQVFMGVNAVVVLGIAASIAERRNLWKELLKSRDDLEVKVRDRTAALTNAYHELQSEMAERKRAEERIKESQETFQRIFDGSLDMIIAVDERGRIIKFNAAAESTFGYHRQDIIGEDVAILYGNAEDHRSVLDALKSERRFMGEITNRRRNGELFWSFLSASVLRDSRGADVGSMGISRDITTLKRAEAKFQALLESAPDAMVIVGATGTIDLINSQAEKLFGYQRDELLGRSIDSLLPARHRKDHERYRILYQATPRARAMGEGLELFAQRKDGTEFPVEISLSPLQTAEGMVTTAAIRDITYRKEAEEGLSILGAIVEWSQDAIVGTTPAGVITAWNPGASATYGYTEEEAIGKPVSMLSRPQSRDDEERHLARAGTGDHASYETKRIRKDGKVIDVSVSISAIKDSLGTVKGIASISRDITERKEAEERMREAFKKEVLLKEIHHRVKNNLQIISSMLSLQAESIADGGSRRILSDSQNRIRSIALIHEMLYTSSNVSRIEFGSYLRSLTHDLISMLGADRGNIVVTIDADNRVLEIDTAIPCGFIVNELISNCVKHAFPDNNHGHIWIEFRGQHDGKYHLSVRDDGTGIPSEILADPPESLGLQLVRLFTEQLEGTLEMRNNGGTEVIVEFSELKYTERT